VVAMAVDAGSPTGDALIAVARHNGSVELMSSTDGTAVATLPPAPASSRGAGAASQPSPVCAICFVPQTTAGDTPEGSDGCAAAAAPRPQLGSLVSCTTSGLVRVHARAHSADAADMWSELRSFQACSSAACMVSFLFEWFMVSFMFERCMVRPLNFEQCIVGPLNFERRTAGCLNVTCTARCNPCTARTRRPWTTLGGMLRWAATAAMCQCGTF